MTGGALVPVVEGQSEDRGMGGFIRRIVAGDGGYAEVARPFRVKRNKVVRSGELERSLRQAVRSRPGAAAVLVVLDADTDCPAELGPRLRARGEAEVAVPVWVILPKAEIEAWLLAGIESLRGLRGISGSAEPPEAPEEVRDAKGALSDRMEGSRGYVATDDLPALLAAVDYEAAARRAPSLAKFLRDVRSAAANI